MCVCAPVHDTLLHKIFDNLAIFDYKIKVYNYIYMYIYMGGTWLFGFHVKLVSFKTYFFIRRLEILRLKWFHFNIYFSLISQHKIKQQFVEVFCYVVSIYTFVQQMCVEQLTWSRHHLRPLVQGVTNTVLGLYNQ